MDTFLVGELCAFETPTCDGRDSYAALGVLPFVCITRTWAWRFDEHMAGALNEVQTGIMYVLASTMIISLLCFAISRWYCRRMIFGIAIKASLDMQSAT